MYLEYIPYTWTACNAFGEGVSTVLLQDMMVLSMLNYQIDEFMEDFVGKNFKHHLPTVENMIDQICHQASVDDAVSPNRNVLSINDTKRRKLSPSALLQDAPHQSEFPTLLSELRDTLTRYITHILKHPSVIRSSATIQSHLATSISQFLKAHIQQIRHNPTTKPALAHE